MQNDIAGAIDWNGSLFLKSKTISLLFPFFLTTFVTLINKAINNDEY